jgi:hypothetical protein
VLRLSFDVAKSTCVAGAGKLWAPSERLLSATETSKLMGALKEKIGRYFFHVRNEALAFDDLIGEYHTGLPQAEARALQMAKDLGKEPDYEGFNLVITDDWDEVVLTLPIVLPQRAMTQQNAAA